MRRLLCVLAVLATSIYGASDGAHAQALSTPTSCLGFSHRGQSNDSGQGALPGGVPVPASNAKQFNYTKGGQWWSMFEPSQSVDSTYGGAAYPIFVDAPILYGPALPFSEAMSAAFPNNNICNFPGAVGGIALANQLPTNSTANTYGAARSMIMLGKAVGGVNVNMIGAVFVGMETDATNSTNAANIVANFTTWVAGFRTDNGANAIVVFAQLGTTPDDTGTYAFWSTVKSNQALINIPGVYMVTTDDLPKQPGNLHYTTAGLQTLGARMAAVMITAMQGRAAAGLMH